MNTYRLSYTDDPSIPIGVVVADDKIDAIVEWFRSPHTGTLRTFYAKHGRLPNLETDFKIEMRTPLARWVLDGGERWTEAL